MNVEVDSHGLEANADSLYRVSLLLNYHSEEIAEVTSRLSVLEQKGIDETVHVLRRRIDVLREEARQVRQCAQTLSEISGKYRQCEQGIISAADRGSQGPGIIIARAVLPVDNPWRDACLTVNTRLIELLSPSAFSIRELRAVSAGLIHL